MTESGKLTPDQRRNEKRAEALRENLKRRKAGRRQPPGETATRKEEEKQ